MAAKNEGFRLMELPQELMERSREMAGRGRDVWLAGLGAVATVEEEGTNLFNNLVERGEKAELFGMRELPQDVLNRGREVWLAGLGALGMAEEKGASYFTDLVERGRKLEERGRKQVDAVRGEVGTRQKEVAGRVESSVSTVYEPLLGALRRFGVPTRAEVRELATNVDALSKKVDALLGQLAPEAAPAASPADQAVFMVVARDEGWALRKVGRQSDISVHATKEEAIEAARAYAGERAPSRLDIYRKDGSLQDSISYEA